MKKTLSNSLRVFMVAIAVMTSSLVSGQPQGGQQGPPPAPSAKQIKKTVSELAEEINLTKEQETKVLALYESHFEEMEEQMSSGSRPSRDKMEKLKTSFENKVKALLSDEQKTKFATYLKKQASRRPGPPRQ